MLCSDLMDIAFCAAAFGSPQYLLQLDRCRESVLKIYPDADLFFWRDVLPPGARPHYASPYGFKIHAINAARAAGFRKVVWLDAAIILVDRLDYYQTIIPQYGMIAATDITQLETVVSDAAITYMNLTRDDLITREMHLVGGSFYYFDFDVNEQIFETWAAMEAADLFYSVQSSHRHDEACLALALYAAGSGPTPYEVCRYNTDLENPDRPPGAVDTAITIKRHFKNGYWIT